MQNRSTQPVDKKFNPRLKIAFIIQSTLISTQYRQVPKGEYWVLKKCHSAFLNPTNVSASKRIEPNSIDFKTESHRIVSNSKCRCCMVLAPMYQDANQIVLESKDAHPYSHIREP